MYDRKTWVILTLCAAILGANIYFTNKNRSALELERVKEEQIRKSLTPPVDAPVTTSGDLTVDPPPPPTEEQTFTLQNDQVVYTLTNVGGGIKFAEFKKQFQVGSNSEMVQLNHYGPGPIGGLADSADNLLNAPAYSYKADESVEGEKVVFITQLTSGLIAKKTFTLEKSDKPGASYLVHYQLKLENTSTAPVNLNQWSLFLGEASPLYQAEHAQQTRFIWHAGNGIDYEHSGAFKGGAKPSLTGGDDEDPVQFAGVTNQYFATVIRPAQPYPARIWAKSTQVDLPNGSKPVTSVRAGLQLPSATLHPGEPKTLDFLVFVGPKDNTMLRKMNRVWGEGWGDVMQYGWFSLFSRTLNFLLNFFHNLIDKVATKWSWGVAIILLTITVRIVLWWPQAKSTHTMKRMAMLQPEMAKIKEKYSDDPNKMNTETMGLYRKYGINPLGGCLPMFIQIPVFFGFYRMLEYAVELRGHGFLWVNDLSQPDTLAHIPILGGIPFNVLPIVMAITSFLQMRMMPKTGDSTQQKIMMFMPLMFFFFCYNFASALALYWTTQNIFSIGQTWLMNKVPEPELKPRSASSRKSFLQRMAEKQAEIQKAQKANSQAGMRDVTPDKKKPRTPRTGG